MAPTGQWYGRTFAGGMRGSKQIALTYDDGPNDPHTMKLLDVLAKHGVRATFFMIGHYVQQRPILRARWRRRTCCRQSHVHASAADFKSAEQTRTELVKCRSALQDAIGEHSNLFVRRLEEGVRQRCGLRARWAGDGDVERDGI